MPRPPPNTTRPDTLLPYPMPFRSLAAGGRLDLARAADFGDTRPRTDPHRGRRGVLRDRVDCAADPVAARDIDRAAEAADLEPRRILAGINAAADDGAVDYEAEIGAGSGDGADGEDRKSVA